MFIQKCHNYVAKYGIFKARILIGLLFLVTGVFTAMNFSVIISGFLTPLGIPMPALLLGLALLMKFAGGLSLVLGYKVRYGAYILMLFVLAVTLFVHLNIYMKNPLDNGQIVEILKNLAIIGGLCAIAAHAPGVWALDNRRTTSSPTPSADSGMM